MLWFSTTSPVDINRPADVDNPAETKNHKINLNDLEEDTTYYVVVGSSNSAGMSTSSETWFHTVKKVNDLAPVIVSIMGSTTIPAGELEEVTLEAFDPEDGALSYSVDWGDEPLSIMRSLFGGEAFVQTSTFTHVYENPGTYTAVFTVKNDLGFEDSASLVITVTDPLPIPDTTAPVITGTPTDITVEAVDSSGATVNFTNPTAIDDVDGNVDVTCNPASGSLFAVGSSTVTCSAVDSSANEATTTFNVLVTPATPPVISTIIETIGSSTTNISWETDESANSKVYYSTDSPVDTTSPTTPFVFNGLFGTVHSIDLIDLATSTLYHFVIESSDVLNNTATSDEMSFTTSSGM